MPIGISLPIRNGNNGYFEQTVDTFSTYKNNLINLLNTIPGERRENPLFGCRLWSFIFEQNTDVLAPQIENIIREDVSRWINGITINSVQINSSNNTGNTNLTDMYTLYINITFMVENVNKQDNIVLAIKPNVS